MKTKRPRLELPSNWKTDRHLEKLAVSCGFMTANRLLRHVANEIARCRTPAALYRALARFDEENAPANHEQK